MSNLQSPSCLAAFIDVRIIDQPVSAFEPSLSLDPFPDDCGAECCFVGRTRSQTHPEYGQLLHLIYECYEEMATALLNELARQAIERYQCRAVRILHARGDVPIGSASVLVQTACGHRNVAFDACRFLIDRLKSEVPIWKREVWERGTTWSPSASTPGTRVSTP